MDPASAQSILLSWRFEPVPALGLLLSALIYWRGWRSVSSQAPTRFPPVRLWTFFIGLAVVYVAIASPLDAFSGWLLTVHMVQHLLLTMIAPPLILLGNPLVPLLSGLPRGCGGRWFGPFLSSPGLQKIGRFLVHPLFAGPLFMISNVFWHTPFFYELALQSRGWHIVEHGCFLGTAILFWWPIVQPWPMRSEVPRLAMIPYMLAADIQNTALSGFLAFSERAIYPTYVLAPRISSLSPVDDQMAAGALMWVPGSMVFLIPVALIFIRFLSPQRLPNDVPTSSHHRRKWSADQWDLLAIPFWGRLLQGPIFRRVLQTGLLLLAAGVIADGFFGPQVAVMNLGGVFPWTYWRGINVVALLVFGNIFCFACPFTFVRDLGRKILPGGRSWPQGLRSKWMAAGLLVAYFWAYEFFHLWNSPFWTAAIVVGYFVAAMVVDGMFRGASFCKYLCPIGQFQFLSSLVSPMEVRVRSQDVCATCKTHDCLRGNEEQRGCELDLFLPRKSGNMDCTFCLDCAKACPHENIGILPVVPGRDLLTDPPRASVGQFFRRFDLAILSIVFFSSAFVNSGAMLVPVVEWENSVREITSEPVANGVFSGCFFLAIIVLPVAAAFMCAGVSAQLGRLASRWKDIFCGFSIALAPMGFGMWLAHYLFHFLSGAFTAWPVAQRLATNLGITASAPTWNVATLGFIGLPCLQVLLLDVGCLLTLWLLWKKSANLTTARAPSIFLPWFFLAATAYIIGVWIIFLPMEMRGTLLK